MNELTQAEVKYHFDYRNGFLYWKHKRIGRLIGNKAGSINNENRTAITLNGSRYLAHRLIFLYHHGYLPEFLDHIDRNPLNNKIENLRPATKSQNRMNTIKRRGNNGELTTSNFKGVCWDKESLKWTARIGRDGKFMNLGRFTNEIDAAKAYNEKAKELHGEFANLNTFSTEEFNMETINKQTTIKEWI